MGKMADKMEKMRSCCTDGVQIGFSTALMACLLILFNQLVCIPLLSAGTGTLDYHYHACAGTGMDPTTDFSGVMTEAQQSAVTFFEQNTAEFALKNFLNQAAFSVVAHGLTMLAVFGASLPDMAEYAGSEEANPMRKMATTLGTFLGLGFAYFIIVVG